MRKFLPARARGSYQVIVGDLKFLTLFCRNGPATAGTPSRPSKHFVFFLLGPKLNNFIFIHTISFHYVVARFCCWWSVFKSDIVTLGTHYQGSEWFPFSASPLLVKCNQPWVDDLASGASLSYLQDQGLQAVQMQPPAQWLSLSKILMEVTNQSTLLAHETDLG